jgi:beta-lactamase superfamily II metal-dependent hydrolase
VDVGHGLCQVIRFGDRAILVDSGGKVGKRVAEDFLKRYIKVVVAYVATHNDSDHVAAAPEILDYYSSATTLKSIWLLLDRPAKREDQTDEDVIPLLGYSKRREEAGTIGGRYPLYVSPQLNHPTPIYTDSAENAEFQLLFPRMFDTTAAVVRGQPNAVATNQSSAILRLVVGGSKNRAAALITGDANCQSFQIAHEIYKFDLSARVLSVPHHGGEIPVPKGAPTWSTVVRWISPEIAVVSAGYGTVPQSTTTKRATFDSLRQNNVTTCCTQITEHCHPKFEDLHPSVVAATKYPLPQMSGRKEFPKAVGCAGTITIKIETNGEVRLVGRQRHQDAVDDKVVPGLGCPHCR